MVRFKNRHLLVEFLIPSQLDPSLASDNAPVGLGIPEDNAKLEDDDDDSDEGLEPDTMALVPRIPFLVPGGNGASPHKLSDEGGKVIYDAVRRLVQEVFGDEGWGRLSSSFRVLYHSPLTTLTLLRIARPHYRTLWAAITLLREIKGVAVCPRVVGVSGTIKKLQNRAITYHRAVTAQMLSVAFADGQQDYLRAEQEKRLRAEWEKEEQAISLVQD